VPETHAYHIELHYSTGRSNRSRRRDGGHRPPRETAGTAELDLLPGADAAGTGQWGLPVDLRPVAATGRCARCGGATWHHQAHDICSRCGRSTQHQAPEVRLLRRSA